MSFSELIALLVPPACVVCRAPLAVASAVVCSACLRDVRWLGADVCRRCGLPSHSGRPCPATRAAWATAWAPLAHEGAARGLVHALKFRGALPVAGLMAAQMAANAPPWALGGTRPRGPAGDVAAQLRGGARPASLDGCAARAEVADGARPTSLGGGVARVGLAVVAVPSTAARRRARGFDPAAVLASELARRLALPVADCLHRSGRAARQVGARRAERRAPGRLQIAVRAPPPERVLLVDDVHTTGATLDACAAALIKGGTKSVHALSYVRTM